MESLFTNSTVDIWIKDEPKGVIAVTTSNPRLAYQLNTLLKEYAPETKFERFETPRFIILASQLQHIRDNVPLLDKIFTQIGKGR
jgi:hypothetical protein